MEPTVVIGVCVTLIVLLLAYSIFVPKSNRGFKLSNDEAFKYNPIMRGFAHFGDELMTSLPENVKVGQQKEYPALEDLIIKSGNPWNVTARELYMMQFIIAIVGGIVGALLWAALYFGQGLTWLPWWVCVIGGIALGHYTPLSKYKEQAALRDLDFRRQLPEALDLLIIAVNAGSTVPDGLRRIIPNLQDGVVKDEFRSIVNQVESGNTFDSALDNLAKRAPNDGVETFVRALQEAHRTGGDSTEILEARSRDSRKDFFTLVRKQVATLSSRVFMVLTPTLIPAVMIIAIAPAASQLMGAIG